MTYKRVQKQLSVSSVDFSEVRYFTISSYTLTEFVPRTRTNFGSV